jgi:predicted nucleic acid-binding protein
MRRLAEIGQTWQEMQPTARLRQHAQRLLRVHPLRAADALQLAAALTAARGDPSMLELVCLDQRLTEAAHREGFRVLP